MNRNLSIYIDVLRTVAALGVFLGHVRGWFMPGMPIVIGAQAGQCVAVFFVLSGFVIAFVVDGKETHWADYARARALRMYSVTILAMVVTLLADRVGYAQAPLLYARLEGFKPVSAPLDYLAYFTFTNQLWWNNRWIGSDQPFWSLGFEVPYYVLFALITFLRGRARWVGVVLACMVIGPRVIAYAPLWLLGVATYYAIRHRKWIGHSRERWAGVAVLGASVVLFAAVRFVLLRKVDNIFYDNGLSAFGRSWLHFHLIGLAVALNIIGFQALTSGWNVWPPRLARTVNWIAGGSFTLYLVHFPLLLLSLALFPLAMHSLTAGLADIVGILAASYLLAEMGERRKKAFQRLLAPSRTS